VKHLLADVGLIVDTPDCMSAAQGGFVNLLKILILDGRFDLRDRNCLVLKAAAWRRNEMLSYLLSLPCIDPNADDVNGVTALHEATK
jgi:hypothetical protein